MTTPSTSAGSVSFNTLPFDGFVYFNPWASCYTARKKITAADLGMAKEDLPPATLASLGSMHSCDPSDVQPFETFRGAMRNACVEFGTRSMGGFLVPRDKAAETAAKLDEIVAKFYDYKAVFIAKFESTREVWLQKPEFAQWTDKIRARLDPIAHVDKQLQCSWEAFVIGSTTDLPSASDDGTPSPLAAGQIKAASYIGNQALEEISLIAKTVFANSLHDKDDNKKMEVTQKILSPIRRIKDKLDALSFSDPRLSQVSRYIDSVLCLLPSEGKLSGNHLISIFNLVTSLCDPETILQFASFGSSASAVMTSQDALQLNSIVSQPVLQPSLTDDSTIVEEDLMDVVGDLAAVVPAASVVATATPVVTGASDVSNLNVASASAPAHVQVVEFMEEEVLVEDF